jgi:hypothetical protein
VGAVSVPADGKRLCEVHAVGTMPGRVL